jgi:hypothetical protein
MVSFKNLESVAKLLATKVMTSSCRATPHVVSGHLI